MNLHQLMRWVCGLAASATLLGLTACGTVQNVPIQDHNSPALSVRGTIHARSGTSGRSEGPGVEVGYERYKASDTQSLAAGQSLVLEGGSISGPETLQHDARMRYGYVAYNHRLRFGDHFELEPFVGAARVHLNMQSVAASSGTVLAFDRLRTGVIGGVTPRWRFNDWVAVEARFSYLQAAPWATGETYEAALVLSPVPQVSLRLGYSERKHDIKPSVIGWWSEVNIRARGPMATLQFDF